MAQANVQRTEEAEDDESTQRPARRPEFTVRVGNVEIAGWKNHGSNGDFYTTSPPKIQYRDEKGEWKDTSSYGALDLLALAEAAREASAKIRELSKGRGQSR